MNIKKAVITCSLIGICTIGFAVNAQASNTGSGKFLNNKKITIVEKLNFVNENQVQKEEAIVEEPVVETTVETEAYINPCPYGHENCAGIHANGNCEYHENCDGQHMNGNENGSGMGYHHNEGVRNQNVGNYGRHGGSHHN